MLYCSTATKIKFKWIVNWYCFYKKQDSIIYHPLPYEEHSRSLLTHTQQHRDVCHDSNVTAMNCQTVKNVYLFIYLFFTSNAKVLIIVAFVNIKKWYWININKKVRLTGVSYMKVGHAHAHTSTTLIFLNFPFTA